MNQKFYNALNGIAQPVPPIWMMRQAGRYHSHYQKLRSKYGFKELCLKAELAAEVALGPVQDFDFDVSILFSDLLFPLEALGMPLEYSPGPKLGFQLNRDTVSRLGEVDTAVEYMQFQRQAVMATREVLPSDKSLIGFVGGAFTLFSYAVQGTHQGGLVETKKNMTLFPEFCKKMTPLLVENIKLQHEAGAEVVMVLDTAAGEVSPEIFDKLISPTLNDLCVNTPGIPLGYYAKNVNERYYNGLVGFKGKGYDHHWSLSRVLAESNRDSGFVQGNFDQSLLHLSSTDFMWQLKQWAQPILELSEQQRRGWICGLGHGITPETPESNVRAFVEFVRQEFAK